MAFYRSLSRHSYVDVEPYTGSFHTFDGFSLVLGSDFFLSLHLLMLGVVLLFTKTTKDLSQGTTQTHLMLFVGKIVLFRAQLHSHTNPLA
jgi:hypothetical protein